MTPLSERVREIVRATNYNYGENNCWEKRNQIVCDAILQAFREVVPEILNGFENDNIKEIDNHEQIRVYGLHQGWNAHHDATVERIK